jgi:hypothetical protein
VRELADLHWLPSNRHMRSDVYAGSHCAPFHHHCPSLENALLGGGGMAGYMLAILQILAGLAEFSTQHTSIETVATLAIIGICDYLSAAFSDESASSRAWLGTRFGPTSTDHGEATDPVCRPGTARRPARARA